MTVCLRHRRIFWFAPRWDQDAVVIRMGWLDGRCPKCGAKP